MTPALAQTPAQSWQNNPPTGQSEADHMVPAQASLTNTLDADSTSPGYQFRATLSKTVHLNDGVALHRGDTLLGKVVTDDMNTPGTSRLAVRFTNALLKNGQNIPIKATIVALYTPGDFINGNDMPTQIPNSWNDGTLAIDQVGVLHNVDLHSRISSQNSGVFVSTKDKDVKLPGGSEFALAIAARNNTPTNPANAGS